MKKSDRDIKPATTGVRNQPMSMFSSVRRFTVLLDALDNSHAQDRTDHRLGGGNGNTHNCVKVDGNGFGQNDDQRRKGWTLTTISRV